jgi:putative transposase
LAAAAALLEASVSGTAPGVQRRRRAPPPRASRLRRPGHDPESQAFIESWFGKLKEREAWLNGYETLDHARHEIGGYVDCYNHRPHSGLDCRTPTELRRIWEDLQGLQKVAT